MRLIKKIKIEIPGVNQEFELGDLTIFIGRPNSGKTRILKTIFSKAGQIRGILKNNPNHNQRVREASRIGVDIGGEEINEDMRELIVDSPRSTQGNIDAYTTGLSRINKSAKKMDPTIVDFGNHGVMQNGAHRNLDIQGSGIQNMMQIISLSNQDNNFLLIDEPEISQFPSGKIQILSRILELLDEKQILFATHDPTLINQYLIKKILEGKQSKVIIYSFCGSEFKKIEFDSVLDPEIHCGYLSQTFSGKPIHLVVEGQTEFYAFQALLHKYCLNKKIHDFPKIINKICVSYLAGGQWKINIHHLPPPEYYRVLMVLDGEYKKDIGSYKFTEDFKVINSINEIEDEKVNVLCLKAKNIEEAFGSIFTNSNKFAKPIELSENIWKADNSIIDKLSGGSDEERQIYEIIEWVTKKGHS